MILSIPQLIDGQTTDLIVYVLDHESLVGSVQIRSKGQTIAKLHSLFVEKEMRLEGIGTQLMKAAENIARHAGCESIGLHVEIANLGVSKFYRKLGYFPFYQFDDGDIQFLKPLTELPPPSLAFVP